MEFREKKSSGFSKYLTIFILLIIIGAVGFIRLSPEFEQDKPEIVIEDNIFWNLKTKLNLRLSDQRDRKSVV